MRMKKKYGDMPNINVRKSGLREWVCEHGIGHPIPSSAELVAKQKGHDVSTWLIHGCDGCCSKFGKKFDKA